MMRPREIVVDLFAGGGGASTGIRAAGWRPVARVDGRAHDTGNRRGRWLPGIVEPTTEIVDRVRWEYGPDALAEMPELATLGRRGRA